jgi:dehydrogenase/reductase SDR family protein 12
MASRNAPLKKIIAFYCRFTPSYSAIGYHARRLFWKRTPQDFQGQTWLVTGGSEGIGGAAARAAVAGGATVICVARDAAKLQAFAASVDTPSRVVPEVADCSLQADIHALLQRLERRGVCIDVLVNNVGIQKRDQILTPEGVEFSFAVNILGHYLLTRELLARGLVAPDAAVIEVASGGMYNHMMVPADLNITGSGYLGVRAYGLAKRAQVMFAAWLREHHRGAGRSFYAMHPGWVDTASVGRSMPRFRAMLQSVLRTHAQGADTIVWLAACRPPQQATEAIWFDRKERPVHIYAHTPRATATREDVVATLDKYLLPAAHPDAAPAAARPAATTAAPAQATADPLSVAA